MSDHNPELDQWRSDGAYQAGYDAAIKDVVAWLDERSDGCCYAGESYSEAIERGEAKGAANE